MILKPDLSSTWFTPTHFDESTDTIPYWPVNTKFPISIKNMFPAALSIKPPKAPRDVMHVNNDITRLIDAPFMDKPTLSHSAFQNPSKPIRL